jgi:beta-galactosidase
VTGVQTCALPIYIYARPYIIYSTTDLHFKWDVPYEPGELRAVTYDNAGNITAETRVHTAGEPARLELTVDRPEIAADSRDVAHVTVRALDAKGNFVPLAWNKITFELSGPAKLIGVDNGKPDSHESYKGATRFLHAGMALALVQSGPQPGPVKLTARAKDLKEATITITTK